MEKREEGGGGGELSMMMVVVRKEERRAEVRQGREAEGNGEEDEGWPVLIGGGSGGHFQHIFVFQHLDSILIHLFIPNITDYVLYI